MKLVSDTYKKSMDEIFRRNGFAKVSFGNVDVDASRDGAWTSSEQQSWSEVSTLDYSYLYRDTIATLELNRWILDGTKQVAEFSGTNSKDGFVSSVMSGVGGAFASPPTMTRSFGQTRIFRGITVTFDTRMKEWPFLIRVDFKEGGLAVDTQTLEVRSVTVTVETEVSGIDEVSITFLEMMPYSFPRVESVIFGVGEVFSNADLVSLKQTHDVDPMSRRLPSEKLSFTIIDFAHRYDPDNPKGIYQYVETNSPVSVQYGYELPDGNVEWVKPDKYLLDGKPTVNNGLATFNATGLIGRMGGTYYKSTVGEKNLYAMAEAVLQDADLPLTELGENAWEIHSSLQNMVTTAVLPIASHMNCLQMIAHAARCKLFTDDDNIIHIQPFGVTVRGTYSGEYADNGHTAWSEWGTVDSGEGSPDTVATLELNRWILDGTRQRAVGTDGNNGFVSSVVGSGNVEFSKTFDVPHDLPILKIRFDDVMEEYPRSATVYYYDKFLNVVDTKAATITGYEATISSSTAENITMVRVVVPQESMIPYTRVRVSKLYFRETDFMLDFSGEVQYPPVVTKIPELKAVTVAKYGYSAGENRTTLFEGTTEETALHVEFSGLAQEVEISVDGGTLVSSSIYGRAADLSLSEGTKAIAITGIPLSESSTVKTYPVSNSGEIDQEENPLITNDAMASALAEHVKQYLHLRNTYDAEYRGNPELETGDIIGLQTLYTPEMDALVLVDEISFNGAFHGAVKLKGLVDSSSYVKADDTLINVTPEQRGHLTYNGSEQSPRFSYYDPAKLEIGGTLTATEAGRYAVTFTPKPGYDWGD